MFVHDTINEAGIYIVKFFINGVETPVVIDDYFPVDDDDQLVFARGRNNEIWVSLVEKAWAKLHGTYARTISGSPCFAANHIMGVPAESRQHELIEDNEEFIAMLDDFLHRRFSIYAVSSADRKGSGIIEGHGYSLISIHELFY